MNTVAIILATLITVVIFCGDMMTANAETKEKLWFRLYAIYMKIAIALMVVITMTPISTFTIVFAVIHVIVILNKDIALADVEAKQKLWFKIYTVYMKIMVGIIIFLGMDGMKFW